MAKSVHDGVSPIIVPDGDEDKAFQALWDYLVPPRGKAQTAQGEIIRIAGRVQYEFLDNGCINWDEDFKKMLDAPTNANAARTVAIRLTVIFFRILFIFSTSTNDPLYILYEEIFPFVNVFLP